jgi:hypothetical protein
MGPSGTFSSYWAMIQFLRDPVGVMDEGYRKVTMLTSRSACSLNSHLVQRARVQDSAYLSMGGYCN